MNLRRRTGLLGFSRRHQSLRIDFVLVAGMHQITVKGPGRVIDASSIKYAPAFDAKPPFRMYVRDLVAHARQANRVYTAFCRRNDLQGKEYRHYEVNMSPLDRLVMPSIESAIEVLFVSSTWSVVTQRHVRIRYNVCRTSANSIDPAWVAILYVARLQGKA